MKSQDGLLPILSLRGLSAGDLQEALTARRYVYVWADGVSRAPPLGFKRFALRGRYTHYEPRVAKRMFA